MPILNHFLLAEATEYEFKSSVEVTKPRSWLKTVSAFANDVGGSIYFGVSDEDIAVGLANAQKTVDQASHTVLLESSGTISKKRITLE